MLLIISLVLIKGACYAGGNDDDSLCKTREIYHQLNDNSLSLEVFTMALEGWIELQDSLSLNDHIIAIIDYSQPSDKKRFYVIDLDAREILYKNYVAHGRNSGELHALKFSNKPYSLQSSLGFYKTAETYYGKHGLSLRLDGLEQGFNHQARKRNIVIHSAAYAEESFITKYGRLGRSFGCPALPKENYTDVIDQIKGGTLIFIYSADKTYLQTSTILN